MAEQVGEIYYDVDFRLDAVDRKSKELDDRLGDIEKSMKNTDKASGDLSAGLSKLAAAIGAVIAASALRDMAALVQNYQEMAERVQMATDSQAEFEMVQKRLLTTANGTFRALSEAQELYIRTADSLRALGYTTGQALDVTDSMSYAFVRNATSADRASSAIDAVSKSFNTGKVAADQWETITTAIPSIIEDIATASGKTASEVRHLGAEGKLTAQQLSEGLRKSLDENAKAAADMSNNLRDAGVRARNALTLVLVSLEEQTGALDTLTNGIITAADAVADFAGDGDKMATALTAMQLAGTAVASVIAGRMLTALAATTREFYASTVAAGAKARAALAAAQSAAAFATAELAAAEANARATVGLQTHAAALTRLSAAQTAATTSTAALTVAQRVAAGATTVLGAAVGGLRTVMAFLGGPVGVLLIAAGALLTFATRAKDAKPPVDLLTGSVNDLGDAALRLQKIQIADKLAELESAGGAAMASGASVEYLRKQLQEFPNSAKAEEWNRRLVEQEAAAETAGKELDTYRQRLKAIDGELGRRASGSTTPTSEEPALVTTPDPAADKAAQKALDTIKARVEALQLEADTLGMTETELELYKLQLAGATDEQIRAAATSRALIDAYEQQKTALEAVEETRKKFGTSPEQVIRGDVKPLSGGAFDEQTARYEAEAEAERVRYAEQLARLQEAEQAKVDMKTSYAALEEQLANEHAARLQQIEAARVSTMLSTGEGLFDDLAGAAKTFAGEQSALYKVMFAASKAFAIADAAVKIQQGIANAAPLPFPANLAAMGAVAAATSSILSNISSVAMAGRLNGGPVQAGGMYRINENGAPEVFQAANGRQFMLPNTRGEVVSNKDASQGGAPAVQVSVNLIENQQRAGTVTQRQDGNYLTVDAYVADIMGGGPMSRANEQAWGLRRSGR